MTPGAHDVLLLIVGTTLALFIAAALITWGPWIAERLGRWGR